MKGKCVPHTLPIDQVSSASGLQTTTDLSKRWLLRRLHARRVRFAHRRKMKLDAGAVECALVTVNGLFTEVILEASQM